MRFVAAVLALLGVIHAAAAATVHLKMTFPKGGTATCAPTNDAAAAAVTAQTSLEQGWNKISLTPNMAVLSTSDVYFALGVAEGFLTRDNLFYSYNNTVPSMYAAQTKEVNDKTDAFIKDHIAFMRKQAATPNPTPFDTQLGSFMSQLEGMAAGSKLAPASTVPGVTALNFWQVFLTSYQTELSDVQTKFTYESKHPTPAARSLAFETLRQQKLNMGRQHCSALIKLTKDDLFVAHDTWSGYNTMLRQYKTYNMPAADGQMTTVTMSSYPGSLSSIDDWYMTSRKLAVTETTNDVASDVIATITSDTVSEFMRVMIANTLASSGRQWVDLFLNLNSGTYNNQYMVVDMKVAANWFNTPLLGEKPTRDLFYVVEQLPGTDSRFADKTAFLLGQAHWPSYNVPYFPEVFVKSGGRALEEEFGSFYSYTEYSRAKIFKKLQGGITDLDGMKRVMRYNNFTSDPDSLVPNCTGAPNNKCDPAYSPMLSIASRGDLALPDPNGTHYGTAIGGFVSQGAFGAIDTKITSYKMMMADESTATGHVISGPTYDNTDTPVFDYTEFVKASPEYASPPWAGVPSRFDFTFVPMTTPVVPHVATVVGPAATKHYLKVAENGTTVSHVSRCTEAEADVVVTRQMSNGWDSIEFTATKKISGDQARTYRALGAAEGFLTADSMRDLYINVVETGEALMNRVSRAVADETVQWISDNIAFMRQFDAKSDTAFGRQAFLFMQQLDGMTEGLRLANQRLPALSFRQVFVHSAQTEITDVFTGIAHKNDVAVSKEFAAMRLSLRQHCSALIKLTKDDLFVAHDTWSSYNSMVRQYKTYNMPAADGQMTTVTMSSYPGSLSSIDDWYMTSRKLAVTETTNDVAKDVLAYLAQPGAERTVLEFMRAMIANTLGNNASHWVDLFDELNSGTYNNQYMVVDMNVARGLFGGTKPTANLFYVYEQLPVDRSTVPPTKLSRSADKTKFLVDNVHWPSYNVPYFPEVFVKSGGRALEEEFGSFFSYTEYSRAKIFKKLQGGITDLDGMKRVMRYNNFTSDPDSHVPNCTGAPNNKCDPAYSPMLSIASRGDLALPNTNGVHYGTSIGQFMSQKAFGAIDTKITSYKMMMDGGAQQVSSHVINGPTNDNTDTPVFDYDAFVARNPSFDGPRHGVPSVFNFTFQAFTTGPAVSSNTGSGDDNTTGRTVAYVIGGVAIVAVVAVIAVIVVQQRRRAAADEDDGAGAPLNQEKV